MTFEERRARGLWRGLNAWENGVPRHALRDDDFRALEGWDAGMHRYREEETRHQEMVDRGKTYSELLSLVVRERREVNEMIEDVKTREKFSPFKRVSGIDAECYFWLQMRYPVITSVVHEALDNGGMNEIVREARYRKDDIRRQELHDLMVLASMANEKKAEDRRRLRRDHATGPISRILRRFGL